MLRIYAKPFLEIQDLLVQWTIFGQSPKYQKLIKNSKPNLVRRITTLIDQLVSPELDMCRTSAERVLRTIEKDLSADAIIDSLQELRRRLIDQIDSIYYLALSMRERDFYDPPTPIFGDSVLQVLPRAVFDLDEAAKCLGLGRYTASVFHLMRAMEHGVQRLGSKMRINIRPENETWHQILLHVNKAVEAMPIKTRHQKQKKARFATCSAHLSNVRIAWRNEVMHPKATYTQDEATEIFSHVKTFMRDLTEII